MHVQHTRTQAAEATQPRQLRARPRGPVDGRALSVSGMRVRLEGALWVSTGSTGRPSPTIESATSTASCGVGCAAPSSPDNEPSPVLVHRRGTAAACFDARKGRPECLVVCRRL